ncbi:glycosyltransferase [Algibacter sp. Ld11]|uniref:glycosyltransferase n=1 Tax=Algibacter sp. Ld11 TaxID=649150 RepID=UPI00386733E0
MISVVIRNKNQDKALTFLLKNLTERYINDIGEIIVIDNLSSDDSEQVAKKYDARFITIEKFSYGSSANLGAKCANFNIVVFFSAHSYPVSHDFFKLIKSKFDNRNDLAGLRCLHSPNDYRNYINNVSSKEDPNKSGLIFSGSAFNKEIWKFHPFNNDVATFEDKEWSKRVIKNGYRIEFVPAIFSYEIKRTKKQELFRYKNDLIGNYQLWQEGPSFKNACGFLVISFVRLFKNLFLDTYYIFIKFMLALKFVIKKPTKLKDL